MLLDVDFSDLNEIVDLLSVEAVPEYELSDFTGADVQFFNAEIFDFFAETLDDVVDYQKQDNQYK